MTSVSDCAPDDGADGQVVLFDRRAISLLVPLSLAAPLCILTLGPRGLALYVAAWAAALPYLLPSLRATLRGEWVGVAFVFLTACAADNLDTVFDLEQRVTLGLVLLSLAYLVARRQMAWQLARTAPVVALVLFFAQQALSAYVLNRDELWPIVSNRVGVVAALMTGAVLVRQADGRRLLPALVVVGALVSVPIMVVEVLRPDLVLVVPDAADGEVRAGGLFAQANNVGAALSFAGAFLVAMLDGGWVSRRSVVVLFAALAVGLVACASRGALVVTVVVVAAALAVHARRRVGRAPIASGLVVAGLLAVAVPPLAHWLARLSEDLDAHGPVATARLGEVALALAGETQDLADDDSSRGALIRQAWTLIGERPLFGRGTRNFLVDKGGRGAHVDFLQVLGENGVVGGALYAALLLALVLAVARLPRPERTAGALVLGAWIVTGLDKHIMLDDRFMVLPLAWIVGLHPAAAARAPAARAA